MGLTRPAVCESETLLVFASLRTKIRMKDGGATKAQRCTIERRVRALASRNSSMLRTLKRKSAKGWYIYIYWEGEGERGGGGRTAKKLFIYLSRSSILFSSLLSKSTASMVQLSYIITRVHPSLNMKFFPSILVFLFKSGLYTRLSFIF